MADPLDCERAPAGWACTRPAGHDGPCAAVRRPSWLSRFVHNVIAHPLLVLCPPLGEWLHEITDG